MEWVKPPACKVLKRRVYPTGWEDWPEEEKKDLPPESEFIVSVRKQRSVETENSGFIRYDLSPDCYEDFFPRLLNLHLDGTEAIKQFCADYGFPGLYWHYGLKSNFEKEGYPIDLPLYGQYPEKIFTHNKNFSSTIKPLLGARIESPLQYIKDKDWLYYCEPVEQIKNESLILAGFANSLLNWENRTKGADVIFNGVYFKKDKARLIPWRYSAETELQKIDGKFYWVPVSGTLLDYAYNYLPVAISNGLSLRICKYELCQKFFISTHSKHCRPECTTNEAQRDSRQRTAIKRRLAKGQTLEEAAKGYDWKKVLNWRENGLI